MTFTSTQLTGSVVICPFGSAVSLTVSTMALKTSQTQPCLCAGALEVKKKRLLIRIFKNFHSGWRCWQLSRSHNRLQHRRVFLKVFFFLSFLLFMLKGQTSLPPVHHNLDWTGRPWLEWLWSLYLCGAIYPSTGMRSDTQTRWTRGETPLKILGSDQLGNKDNRFFSTEFQWIGKTKQTLERKTSVLNIQKYIITESEPFPFTSCQLVLHRPLTLCSPSKS